MGKAELPLHAPATQTDKGYIGQSVPRAIPGFQKLFAITVSIASPFLQAGVRIATWLYLVGAILVVNGLTMAQIDAVKTHNPFAINDLFFARETGADLKTMNNFGCSLVWGHPQAPMGTRAIIEVIEELAQRGGGWGLFTGCAAGDTAMAVVLEVTGA